MKVSDIKVDYVGHYGSDETVVNAARVSFHKTAENYTPEQNEKLIKYLAKNKHFSPFNHTFLSFKVKAPIFVGRQLVKHRFMPWNEVSRRYVDEEPEFYIPQMRERAENVKQGSGDVIAGRPWIEEGFKDSNENTLKTYQWLLGKGVAPEVARAILPQNMMTEWMWSGTLGAYADMLKLRLDPHAQFESRIVAERIKDIVADLFPVSINALLNNQ